MNFFSAWKNEETQSIKSLDNLEDSCVYNQNYSNLQQSLILYSNLHEIDPNEINGLDNNDNIKENRLNTINIKDINLENNSIFEVKNDNINNSKNNNLNNNINNISKNNNINNNNNININNSKNNKVIAGNRRVSISTNIKKNSKSNIRRVSFRNQFNISKESSSHEIREKSVYNKCILNPFNKQSITTDLFISIKGGSIKEFYTLGKMLGIGGFGKVNIVTHKLTGIKRAMKTIRKKELLKEDEKKLFSEMTILKKLDHPNIIKLFELFQDDEHYYLITEYLSGGELLDKVKKNESTFSEKKAAYYLKQILSGLVYLHSKRVCHRDLKPQNVMFDSDADNAILKIIDFGIARIFNPKKTMSKCIGTLHYMAPEVLKKKYNEKCDIWSCGVILYLMLSGKPPFSGSEGQIINGIKNNLLYFNVNDFEYVSADAKNLIRKMLTVDYNNRPSANEVRNDFWIQKNASPNPLNSNIMENLANFQAQEKLNTAILTFIVTQLLGNEEKDSISKTFQSLDKNGDGLISKQELIEGFIKLYKSKEKAVKQVEIIQKEMGLVGETQLNYTQFVIATMNKEKILTKQKLEQAFKILDLDGDGVISKQEIENLLGGTSIPEKVWKVIIKSCDEKKNGKISYGKFVDLLLEKLDNKNKN